MRLPSGRAGPAAAVGVVLLLGNLVAACGGDVPSTDPSTPMAAVAGYYHALEHHQLAEAASYVAPGARGSVTSENGNIISLTHLRITVGKLMPASLLPALPVTTSDYSSFAQVVATFKVRLHEIIDSPDGPQVWFLYLGKARNQHLGWQIVSSGSGP